MATLTILRHGKSLWNKEKRFTGWTDVALSDSGIAEAKHAGQLLKTYGITFDLCFTSYLKRAIDTLEIVLETMNLSQTPIHKDWRLNERHYGVLQGLTWWEARKIYGAKQVLAWQREFDHPPPPLEVTDSRFPGNDPLYAHLPLTGLPRSESLKDTLARFLPFWQDVVIPELTGEKRILIVAHHNSLRGLVKYLDDISNADIANLRIRTADPILYQLDKDIIPISKENLRPRSALSQLTQKVFNYWLQRFAR